MTDTNQAYLNYQPSEDLLNLIQSKQHSSTPPQSNCRSTSNSERHLGPAVLWNDPVAVHIREDCDYTQRFDMATAMAGHQTRALRIYCEGVFDMFHYGHARMLWQAKTHFPGPVRLIVGLSNQTDCERQKRTPVMSVQERLIAVAHCRYVDEVVPECPWDTRPEFFQHHKIDFFCHDAQPYVMDGQQDIYDWIKRAGLFFSIERTPHISTTDLIARLLSREDLAETVQKAKSAIASPDKAPKDHDSNGVVNGN